MKTLRSDKGCPWDKEQTHFSLLKYLKEESEELSQAVQKKDWFNLQEELGDVLLQVIFHSQMASEKGAFHISDVIDTLAKKLTLRHPHVFGSQKNKKWTSQDVKDNWNDLKTKEKFWKDKASKKLNLRMRKVELI
ncbi:MAG: MazG nucleotide pyrophosphohydrolase domain-containing protein [Elusimicrobiota bacterium]